MSMRQESGKENGKVTPCDACYRYQRRTPGPDFVSRVPGKDAGLHGHVGSL